MLHRNLRDVTYSNSRSCGERRDEFVQVLELLLQLHPGLVAQSFHLVTLPLGQMVVDQA